MVNKMNKGMSEIVQGVCRIVSPCMFIFGFSLVIYGHITPGGGFSGGIVIACSFILKMLAFGKEKALEKLPLKKAEFLHSISILGFLTIAALGFVKGIFFYNFLGKGKIFNLFSGGTILLNNIMIGVKIGVALFVVIILLSMTRFVEKDGKIEYFEEEEKITK